MEIIGGGKPFEISEKRFYVEGVTLKSKCPQCGQIVERDCGQDYFMYPKANEPIEVNFCHEARDSAGELDSHEWQEQVILRVAIEAVPRPDGGE